MNPAAEKFIVDGMFPAFVRSLAGKTGHGACRVLCLAILLALPCGQAGAQPQQNDTDQLSNRPLRPLDPIMGKNVNLDPRDPVYQQRQARQLNAAMHKSMVSDTDKLLKLVTELNAEISSANTASLTPEQLRMVAEIEKLAHGVKDKMRIAVQPTPSFMDTTQPITDPSRR